jgi:hypothetical protein
MKFIRVPVADFHASNSVTFCRARIKNTESRYEAILFDFADERNSFEFVSSRLAAQARNKKVRQEVINVEDERMQAFKSNVPPRSTAFLTTTSLSPM